MMQLQLILAFILIAAPSYAGDEKDRYIQENRLIEEELNLARKPDIYFVFNLTEKTVSIKARGITLKEMPMNDARIWGSPVWANVYRLQKKSTLIAPSRETIKPGESKNKDNFEIEALELADMPSRFTLVFDRGLKIWIRPQTEGIVSGMLNVCYTSIRFVIRPVSMLLHTFRGEPYTTVHMILDGNDARAIYWSISDGYCALIYPPM